MKIFECSCVDGFTGDFCEFKTEQDHLLFFDNKNVQYVLNANGRLIEERAVDDEQIAAYGSCSTVFKGEAIIFGDRPLQPNLTSPNRQVQSIYC